MNLCRHPSVTSFNLLSSLTSCFIFSFPFYGGFFVFPPRSAFEVCTPPVQKESGRLICLQRGRGHVTAIVNNKSGIKCCFYRARWAAPRPRSGFLPVPHQLFGV